jgi:hypothetical protein
MFPGYKELTLWYKRIGVEELKELVKDAEVLNYVRHESTVKVLSEILGKQLTPNTCFNCLRSFNSLPNELKLPKGSREY